MVPWIVQAFAEAADAPGIVVREGVASHADGPRVPGEGAAASPHGPRAIPPSPGTGPCFASYETRWRPSGCRFRLRPCAAPAAGGKSFSPYVDVGQAAGHDLLGIVRATGHLDYTLAFVQSSGPGTVGFEGGVRLGEEAYPGLPSLKSQIGTLRAWGGTITISVGGDSGVDPAMVAADATQLQARYQSIIDTFGVDHLDFDIENAPLTDQASIDLRDRAIGGLERANPGLHVTFTLPVTPAGLPAEADDVLLSAARAGVKLDEVNIMAMDYASGGGEGAMGKAAISAAKGTEAQIRAAGLAAKVSVTPMIGRNDEDAQVFTLADARELETFAAETPWVSGLGMWSITRDEGGGGGSPIASATDSGISQEPYAFTAIFSQVGRASVSEHGSARGTDGAGLAADPGTGRADPGLHADLDAARESAGAPSIPARPGRVSPTCQP